MATPQRTHVSRGSITNDANTQSTHATPFDLTPHDPTRHIPLNNDVVYFPFEHSHALLTDNHDGSFDRLWLNGFHTGETDTVHHTELEYLADINALDIIASNVTTIQDVWWVVDDTQFPDVTSPFTHRDSGSPTRLTLLRDRDQIGVNEFLTHPIIDHDLGDVPGWKAAFTAVYNGKRVATAILSRPAAPALDASKIITLSRYAAHPNRPPNTASWLLARARRWAALEGYDELRTYAGVSNDNEGTIYQATGFTLDDITDANGDGWTNREGRDSWNDYTRRRYVASLDAYTKPDPNTISSQQPSLDAYTGDTDDDTQRARFDHMRDTAANAFDDLTDNPGVHHVHEADAVFGTITDNTITGIIPVTYYDTHDTGEIHGIAFNDHEHEYPSNIATSIMSDIIDWVVLEGGHRDDVVCSPMTSFERTVCKQSHIHD